jgi:MFS family permease
MNLGFAFFIIYYQEYAKVKFDFDVKTLGYVIAWFSLWVGITQGLLIRPITKYFMPARAMLIFMPVFALSYLLMLIPTDFITTLIWFPFLPIFQGFVYPNSLAIVSNSASKTIQGEIIGINQSIISLSSAIPPILAGFVVAQLISFTMWLGAVCTLIAWLVFLSHHYSKRFKNK